MFVFLQFLLLRQLRKPIPNVSTICLWSASYNIVPILTVVKRLYLILQENVYNLHNVFERFESEIEASISYHSMVLIPILI